ncbi:MAG: L,D-transpeptidase [Gammaproteobacteria bacterium]|nr:L,D-transpeptidase [Gammaproteobacteria bacterium]
MNHSLASSIDHCLVVSLSDQTLTLFRKAKTEKSWPVSTALNGAGEDNDSGCTPRGEHRIRIKIGEGCPMGSVFRGRRPSGEIYSDKLARQFPHRDWILTRLLWLTGCESGRNRGGETDTLKRYIYIHGTPDTEPMGKPVSHGCIRMRNSDIVELFDLVENAMPVIIQD